MKNYRTQTELLLSLPCDISFIRSLFCLKNGLLRFSNDNFMIRGLFWYKIDYDFLKILVIIFLKLIL